MSQISTPRSFFQQVVIPDFDAYYGDQGNVRLAFHVCMSLDHLVDWIAAAKGMAKRDLLAGKRVECPDLQIVRDISVNIKHFAATSAPTILLSVKVEPMSVLDWKDVRAVPDVLAHGVGNQVKAVQGGQEIWLLNPVSGAFHFWKHEYESQLW